MKNSGHVFLFANPVPYEQSFQVKVTTSSKISYLKAYGELIINKSFSTIYIENPWIKVKIDNKEGWMKDSDDLDIIGLWPAG